MYYVKVTQKEVLRHPVKSSTHLNLCFNILTRFGTNVIKIKTYNTNEVFWAPKSDLVPHLAIIIVEYILTESFKTNLQFSCLICSFFSIIKTYVGHKCCIICYILEITHRQLPILGFVGLLFIICDLTLLMFGKAVNEGFINYVNVILNTNLHSSLQTYYQINNMDKTNF